jgi:phosphate transport system protein
MTRESYEHQLEILEKEIENMGLAVESALALTWKAMNEIDHELSNKIIVDDRIINDMQRDIEAKCLTLITKQQPVAGDLRMVSTALKIVTDLERIGDHAADIAGLVLRFEKTSVAKCSPELKEMLYAAMKMVNDAVKSLVDRDKELAANVVQQDDIVDGFFNDIKLDVISKLKNDDSDPDLCVDTLMVAKYLERIGDHATNIAEWEVFQETGTIRDVRIF